MPARFLQIFFLALVGGLGYLAFHPELFLDRREAPPSQSSPSSADRTIPEEAEAPPRFLHRIDCQGRTPAALAVRGGNLHVAYRGLNLIDVFDPQGRRISFFDAYPKGRIDPVDLAVDPEGRLYVADARHRSILTFDGDDRFIGPFPPRPSGPEAPDFLAAPVGIDIHGNLLFVSDFGTSTVKLFGLDGTLLLQTSAPEGDSAAPWHPLGIASSGDGRFFVSDVRGRVSVFSCDGTFAHLFEDPEGAPTFCPGALVLDDQKRVHVADPQGRRILMYDNYGRFLTAYGADKGESGWTSPLALAADTEGGLIFIADPGKKTIDVWSTR